MPLRGWTVGPPTFWILPIESPGAWFVSKVEMGLREVKAFSYKVSSQTHFPPGTCIIVRRDSIPLLKLHIGTHMHTHLPFILNAKTDRPVGVHDEA